MVKASTRFMLYILIFWTIGLGMSFPFAAGFTPDQISASTDEHHVLRYLERDNVRAKLESQGVDADIAKASVDALTDDEVKAVAGHLDQVPTGNSEVLVALLAVIIVLLITDFLGLTKIFSFIRLRR